MIRPYETDFHIHPDFSIDAKGSIDEYCNAALAKGLRKICFTTHIDLDPRRNEDDPFMMVDGQMMRVTPKLVQRYYDEIASAMDIYKSNELQIYAGVEVDYFDGVEETWSKIKGNIKFDYILGSVHCIEGIAFTWSKHAPLCFEKFPLEVFFEKYYTAVAALAKCGLFDCVGHLDCYRRYGYGIFGESINNPPEALLKVALSEIRNSGIGIEINSAASRQNVGSTYPSRDILKLAAETEVPIVALGSDAHSPADLGAGLDISSSYLDEIGLRWKPKC